MTRKDLQNLMEIYHTEQKVFGVNSPEALEAGARYHRELTKYTKQRAKANGARQDREAAYKDLGLVKVRGALGGTYYE
jgi:hypothetical protein